MTVLAIFRQYSCIFLEFTLDILPIFGKHTEPPQPYKHRYNLSAEDQIRYFNYMSCSFLVLKNCFIAVYVCNLARLHHATLSSGNLAYNYALLHFQNKISWIFPSPGVVWCSCSQFTEKVHTYSCN